MFERFTDGAKQTVVYAQERALDARDAQVEPRHLIAGAVEADEHAVAMLIRCGADPDQLMAARNSEPQTVDPPIDFSDSSRTALELGLRAALQLKHRGVSGAHLLLGALEAEPDSSARTYLASRGVSVDDLREALGRMREINGPGFESRIATISSLLAGATGGQRDRLNRLLVDNQIGALKLREAHEYAAAHAIGTGESRQHWLRQLVAISELVGDARAVVRHGHELLVEADQPLPGIHASVARAHALAGDSAQAWDAQRVVPMEPTGALSILMIEAAETWLLLGEAERSVSTLQSCRSQEPGPAGQWRMLVRAQQGRAGFAPRLGRAEIESALTGEDVGSVRWIEARLRAEALHAELASGSARGAAKEAAKLAAESRELGLGGVLCDALEVRALALASTRSRRLPKAVDAAIAEAERLGRGLQAGRIRRISTG